MPEALFHRPNLVTKAALIDQSCALSTHEVDDVDKYDFVFARDSNKTRLSSNFSGQQRRSPVSEVTKDRILRHHSKIMTAKKMRDVLKKPGVIGNSPSPVPSFHDAKKSL